MVGRMSVPEFVGASTCLLLELTGLGLAATATATVIGGVMVMIGALGMIAVGVRFQSRRKS